MTLLDAADEPGGTWHYNTYPGAACDVPSVFYCFSYAQRPDWTRICSPQAEILAYLHDTAVRFDVARRVVTGVHVSACRWDDATRQWTVVDDDGTERTCDALVVATGQLNQPADPRVEGLADFAGHAFHSARWDHDYDLRGKRVAVIGTGASAVQFVPEIVSAGRAARRLPAHRQLVHASATTATCRPRCVRSSASPRRCTRRGGWAGTSTWRC